MNNNNDINYDALCNMSIPDLSMFDPNDVNNVKADPATFDYNAFVGGLNLTSAQLKTLNDAFQKFKSTSSYNLNGTVLEMEDLQRQFNRLYAMCANECPKCVTLGPIQSNIAIKNAQKTKELEQHKMLDTIIHMIEQRITMKKQEEDKAVMLENMQREQEREQQKQKTLNQRALIEMSDEFNIALGNNDLDKAETIYINLNDLFMKHVTIYAYDELIELQNKLSNLYHSLRSKQEAQPQPQPQPQEVPQSQGGNKTNASKKRKQKKFKKSNKFTKRRH